MIPNVEHRNDEKSVEAKASDFASNLSRSVRNDPIPAALVAMGVAWLFMGGGRTTLFGSGRPKKRREIVIEHDYFDDFRHGPRRPQRSETMDFGRNPAGFRRDDDRHASGSTGRSASQTVSGASSHVGDAASDAYRGAADIAGRGSEAMGAALRSAGSTVSDAGSTASEFGSHAYDASLAAARDLGRGAGRMGSGLAEFFEDRPLALGVLGLAVGAGIAAALPTTRTEARLMGEASDAVKDQVADLAGEGVEAARRFAGDAVSRVADEASSQGLTAGDASDAVRTVGGKLSAVADAAVEATKKEVGAS